MRAAPVVGASFVVNRVLVAVLLAAALGGFFALAERMLKAGWSSQVDVALAMALALATGALFQANARRIVRFVDRLFLPRRYATIVALQRIAASLQAGETRTSNGLARDVAQALGLVSVAIFTRTDDGGFVRRAAFGWPGASAWHLLPGEALTQAMDGRAAVVALADASYPDVALPEGEARPRVAVTVRRRKRVRSAILLGSERGGGTPDADTARGLAAILGEVLAE